MSYSIAGVDDELEQNISTWLGPEPESTGERLNFVASARARIEDSLEALGYYQPVIDIKIAKKEPTWRFAVRIDAGEPVHIKEVRIAVSGAALEDSAYTRLLANPPLAEGDVLHHGRYTQFRNKLLSLAQRRGYFDATITRSRVEVNIAAGTAVVIIDFNSGQRYRFGDFNWDEQLLAPELLDSLRTFRPGDFYDQGLLQEFQSQLQRTGYFSGVLVRPLQDEIAEDSVPIAVIVHEAKRHSFDVGVGYSTDTRERVSLTWHTPKINSLGHSQVTRLEYSPVNPGGRVTYKIPLTHPLNDVLQLSARAEDNEFGDIQSRQNELGARRELRRTPWIVDYSVRGLNESWDLLRESFEEDFLLLGFSVSSRGSEGPIVDPSEGFHQLYKLEVAGEQLGSDLNLARFTAQFRYVFTPVERHRVVARTELGAVETKTADRKRLAPSLNFFAGGNQSIRGFAYQSLGNEIVTTGDDGNPKTLVVGGDRLFTASVEYQYYVTSEWRAAVFTDAGDAFDEGEFNMNYGAGVGVHYISPVGALRFELARSLSEDKPDWYIHLNVGAEF